MFTHKGLNYKASCLRRVLHAHNYVTSDELPYESLKILKAENDEMTEQSAQKIIMAVVSKMLPARGNSFLWI